MRQVIARIDSIKFGEITINKKTYYSDVLIDVDGKVELMQKKHMVDIDDFIILSKKKPEFIVIGTGLQDMVRVSDKVIQIAEDSKIKLYVDPSPKAADVFNGLLAQGKKTAALIHTTC